MMKPAGGAMGYARDSADTTRAGGPSTSLASSPTAEPKRPRFKRFFSKLATQATAPSRPRAQPQRSQSTPLFSTTCSPPSPPATPVEGVLDRDLPRLPDVHPARRSNLNLSSILGPSSSKPRRSLNLFRQELVDPSNRLSAHFDMIEISEVRDIRPADMVWIPPYRRVAYRPPGHSTSNNNNTDTVGTNGTARRRIFPRIWDVVASNVSSRRKIKDVRFWPELEEAVEQWFPLDGEEGELVEDEGFLDGVAEDSQSISSRINSSPHHEASTSTTRSTSPSVPEPKRDFISDLPPELGLYIFLLLDLPSIVSASAVARYWNALSRDSHVWRDLFYSQPHYYINPARARRAELCGGVNGFGPGLLRKRLNSKASRASSTFASPAALYSRWGRNSLLSLRSMWTGDFSFPAAAFDNQQEGSDRDAMRRAALAGASSDAATVNGKVPMELTLALDWQEIFRSRWELDRRWEGKGSADPRITHFIGHGDSVYCVEYDHQHIISGSRDRTIRIWATPSTHSASSASFATQSQPQFPIPTSFNGSSTPFPFTPTASTANLLSAFPAAFPTSSGTSTSSLGKPIATLRGHDGSVLCLKFDSATGFMVSGSSDCRILVWDLNELGRDRSEGGSGAVMTPKATLRGHTMGVLDLKFDDEWIVSCAKDTTVRLWSRSTLEQEHVFAGHSGPVNAIDMSRATKRIISASGDGTLILWDILTRTAVRTFTGHTRGLACVVFASLPSSLPDSEYGRTIRERKRATSSSSSSSSSSSASASSTSSSASAASSAKSNSSSRKAPDELIISGSNDKTIRIWSARTGECLYVQQEEGVGHADLVRALAYDQSTGRLVSASYDQTSIVWDLERVVRGSRGTSVDEGYATSAGDGDAQASGEEESEGEGEGQGGEPVREEVRLRRVRQLKGYHSSHIFDVKFDLSRIVSTSHDRTIVVVDFAADLPVDPGVFLPD